jgi:hypothetical protein
MPVLPVSAGRVTVGVKLTAVVPGVVKVGLVVLLYVS